jgi:hypothetical protein
MDTIPTPTTSSHLVNGHYELLAETLVENLYLRWRWCFTYVEAYGNADGMNEYLIIGSHQVGGDNDKNHSFVVKITQVSDDQSDVAITTSRDDMNGWPVSSGPKPVPLETHGKIAEAILDYCLVAHGEGKSVADAARNLVRRLFSDQKSKRKRLA